MAHPTFKEAYLFVGFQSLDQDLMVEFWGSIPYRNLLD